MISLAHLLTTDPSSTVHLLALSLILDVLLLQTYRFLHYLINDVRDMDLTKHAVQVHDRVLLLPKIRADRNTDRVLFLVRLLKNTTKARFRFCITHRLEA